MAESQDQDNLDVVNGNDPKQGQNDKNQVAEYAKDQAGEQVKKKLLEKIGSIKIGDSGTLGSFAANVFSVVKNFILEHLVAIIVPFVIIIVAIGFISFFLNVPGFIRGQIEQKIANLVGEVNTILWGENGKLSGNKLDIESRKAVLQYISDMGLDVVGYGFVPQVVYDSGSDEKIILSYSTNLSNLRKDESEGVADPRNDLIYFYVMANERAYIRRTAGILGGLFAKTKWEGMLDIDGDEGFEGLEAKVDRENKLLTISVNNPELLDWFKEDNYSFSLEGWTGRFGMPLEFSLALHLATMSSGMTEELVTNPDLQTEVKIGLQQVKNCKVLYKFVIKNEDGNLTETPTIPFKREFWDDYGNLEIGNHLENLIEANQEISEDDLSIKDIYDIYFDENGNEDIMLYSLIEEIIQANDSIVDYHNTLADEIRSRTVDPAHLQPGEQLQEGQYAPEHADALLNRLSEIFDNQMLPALNRIQEISDNQLDPELKNEPIQEFLNGFNEYRDTAVSAGLTTPLADLEFEGTIEDYEAQLSKMGLSVFSNRNVLKYIYNAVKDAPDELNYAQPYIERVIKHWYKDLSFEDAYERKTDTIELGFTSSAEGEIGDGMGVEIAAQLIIENPDNYLYKQTQQPYVVKGDIVLLDGEVQEGKNPSDLQKIKGEDGYNWGDGYRATKKIFTQGYYYSYDGTPETSLSIYYQEAMEDVNSERDAYFKVSVLNGRVYFAKEIRSR